VDVYCDGNGLFQNEKVNVIASSDSVRFGLPRNSYYPGVIREVGCSIHATSTPPIDLLPSTSCGHVVTLTLAPGSTVEDVQESSISTQAIAGAATGSVLFALVLMGVLLTAFRARQRRLITRQASRAMASHPFFNEMQVIGNGQRNNNNETLPLPTENPLFNSGEENNILQPSVQQDAQETNTAVIVGAYSINRANGEFSYSSDVV